MQFAVSCLFFPDAQADAQKGNRRKLLFVSGNKKSHRVTENRKRVGKF